MKTTRLASFRPIQACFGQGGSFMARKYCMVYLIACSITAVCILMTACGDEHPLRPRAQAGTISIDSLPDTLDAAWSLRDPAGFAWSGIGDTLLADMAAGPYLLTWGSVTGWSPPVPASRVDTLEAGGSLRFVGTYLKIQDKGTILVDVSPDTIAAPWSLTGPGISYDGAGSKVLGALPTGEYTIRWLDLDSWLNPLPISLTAVVTKDDTTRFAHTYLPGPTYRGNLRIVHSAPTEAFTFAWEMTRAQDESFFMAAEGDTLLVGLPEDYYYVRCTPVAGFDFEFPYQDYDGDRVKVRVWEGRDAIVHAIFIPDDEGMGLVTVAPIPADLGAPWTLAGPYGILFEQAGTITYRLPPGEVTLAWGEVAGWVTPEPAELRRELPFAGAIEFVGEYLSLTPLVVPDFTVEPAARIGGVDAAWTAVLHTASPIVEYLVLCSTEGPIDSQNRDRARILAAIPAVVGQEHYTLPLAAASDGLVPGQPTWFAVQARDTRGALSPPTAETQVVPTFERRITGQVCDERGEPIPDLPIMVTMEDGASWLAATDGQGHIDIAAGLSDGGLVLATRSADSRPGAWFDYRLAVAQSAEAQDVRICLLPRYATDPSCDYRTPDFLDYILEMTNTDDPTSTRPDQGLYKWDHWPLEVFLQESPVGIELDFPGLTALALNQWNATMGEDLFIVTGDSLAADVVVVYSDAIPQVNGQVTVLAPPGMQYLGDDIPQKLGLYLNTAMAVPQRIIEVAMHELGHVLGIAGHSLCYEAGYLMYVSSAGALDGGMENAIHPDEQILVRTIRTLPQGVDMAGYVRE